MEQPQRKTYKVTVFIKDRDDEGIFTGDIKKLVYTSVTYYGETKKGFMINFRDMLEVRLDPQIIESSYFEEEE